MKRFDKIHSFLAGALLLLACGTIPESPPLPDEPPCMDVDLKLQVDLSFTQHIQTQIYTRADPVTSVEPSMSKSMFAGGDLRVIVEVYNPDRMQEVFLRDTFVFIDLQAEQYQLPVHLRLPARRFVFLVWMDHVESATKKDLHYITTDNLMQIRLHQDAYCGNSFAKDVSSCRWEVDLTPYEGKQSVVLDEILVMERPIAWFQLQATDVDAFLDQMNKKASTKVTLDELQEYSVQVNYNGFFPSGYNVESQLPNAAVQGLSFTAPVMEVTRQRMTLAMDQVFVDDKASSVTLNFSLYDQAGREVCRITKLDVHYRRAYMTLVQGDFLTLGLQGGVGIETDFEGEYNVAF